MLNKVIEFSVRNKLIIGLLTIGLILWGIYEATRLPIDAQPDITNNQVQIITVAPSYGAADIERLVTIPVELANSNIKGIEEIRSFSRFGLSLVTIVFSDDTEVYWARQQVSERLATLKNQIPEHIGVPELGPISTGLGEIFQYVVRAEQGYEEQYTAMDLRTIQDWQVRRQLLSVKGVAEVSSFGGKLKQYEIALNPNKLQAFQLSIQDVFKALEANNQNTGGAYIEKANTVMFIRSEGLVGSIEDIEQIAVKQSENGTPILIKNIASVQLGYATRYGAMTYNDQGEVSGAIVLMLKGANSNEVIKNIKERIAAIQQTLPKGVVIEPFLDRAKMVNTTISTVKTNLIEGALIVVFILVIFLGNLRAGLLVASVIPLSMLFAVIMMNAFGVGGNLMSLGALDFGLIVDGAVIIVEAVLHQINHRKKSASLSAITDDQMNTEVTQSATKMVNSAVFGQIIILVVYLPIFSLSGIEGKMFKPMAQTVAFALIGAFLLSLTYVPMMSAWILQRKAQTKALFSDRIIAKAAVIHQRMLQKAIRHSKKVLGAVGLMFVLAVVLLSKMGGEFIPSLEEGDFAVEMRILPGSNINTTIAAVTQAAHILKTQFPEVEKVVTKIGSAEIPTEPMPMDAGDMIVVLKPKKQWTSARSFPELSKKMSEALEEIPGLTTGFQFPVQMRFNELLTGARQDVVCKIYGENLDTLSFYANQLGKLIEDVKGAQDIYIEPVSGLPQVVIDYDRNAIARYGLSITDINNMVNMAFAGSSTGSVYEGERRFDMVVRLDTLSRQNLSDIQNLLIPIGSTAVPLHQLAHVSFRNSPNQIQRENTSRRIMIGFNARGRDVQSLVQELQQKVTQQLHMPSSYTITYGGSFENLQQAKERLGIAVPIALLLIFLLLYFAFKSVKYSLLIYTAIPLSAIGGIYLLSLRGMPFSISAGIGFIALFGVAVLNGIVLIAEFNQLKKSRMQNNISIVLRGTQRRLRPVLMTAFVASFGFLPMAISNGAGAEVQRPLATVVIGGLILATFLTLFVLPILYIVFEKTSRLPKKKIGKSIVAILCIALATIPNNSIHAQTTVLSLEQAIVRAEQNNNVIRNKQLLAQYHSQLQKTAWTIEPTAISAELGNINTNYFDNKIGVSQNIAFPTVYGKRRAVLNAQTQYSNLETEQTRYVIERAVTESFYALLILQQKKQLLTTADSLFTNFARKAALRLEKGGNKYYGKYQCCLTK
jgi:cobalt-zinc-cadmium resistance protein CzcA